VAELNLKEIMEAKIPEENIQIFPHDVISVPKAEMVYVIGEVKRSGGFVLGEHEVISVLQALRWRRASTQLLTHGMPGSCA